jgi:hypothetical protein
MKRRTFAAAVATTPLLNACFYDDFFTSEWEEEIQLHDKSVIVANVKQTFVRLTQGITPYGGMIVPRDCTFTFDAGKPFGKVSQLFRNFRPIFLDREDGVWYAVLKGKYFAGYKEITGQYWGELEVSAGQRAIKLVDGKWQPISMRYLPAKFKEINILVLYGAANEWAKFDSTHITLGEKAEWLIKHPHHPDNYFLKRPREADSKNVGSIPLPTPKPSK